MRVTVCFGRTRVTVPCKGGATVTELVKEACIRYKRAIGQNPSYYVKIRQLEHAFDGGILDWDDYVYDVAEDRDQLIAVFDEEDKHSGNNAPEEPGSDGLRNSQFLPSHHSFNNRFNDGMSPGHNRGRPKAPTGNATVIKHDDRKDEHEVNVGADALKSDPGSSITVRGPQSSIMKDDDRIKSPLKINSGYSYEYKRMDSANEQKDKSHTSKITMTMADANESTFSAAPDKLEKHNFSGKSHFLGKKHDNFSRGNTRQSIMGYLSGDHLHDAKYEEDSYQLVDDDYLLPTSTNPTYYPRFYHDSQETYIDIDDRKLGIEIRSYKENKLFLGLMVESVEKGGRSDRENLLQEGDIIVEINGHILARYDYTIAQELFKEGMKQREIQLRVYPNEERERENQTLSDVQQSPLKHKHVKSPSIPALSVTEPTPTKPRALSSAKSLPNLNDSIEDGLSQDVSSDGKLTLIARMSLDTLSNNTKKIGNMFEIELRKGHQGLGFSITTRDTPISGAGPIYVKNILPKGAAIQDGRLRAGDRLLQVNDVELTGHSQESAVNILRCIEVGSTVKLVVSRHINILPRKMKDDPVADKVISDDANREYFKFEIALNDTGSAGLGISLKGNQSKKTKQDLGIFVKSVFHGGAAHQDGRLEPNDQLISVNGQSLVGMTNHEAIDTLRTSMSTVGNVRGMIQMVIARRKSSANEPLSPYFSSEASSEISDSLGNERGSRASIDNNWSSAMDDEYIRHSETVPRQIDPNFNDVRRDYPDGDRPSSDPDFDDPGMDPFLRESIFRQSISEKRKGAAARDTQNMDIVKVLKNKQLASEKGAVEKKVTDIDSLKHQTPPSPASTPVKWVKPGQSTRNNSTNLTPSKQPIPAKRNLNNSSNLPARTVGRSSVEQDVQVGPTLGIAKSSSLESLQTALENLNDDNVFPKAPPRVLRGRVLNESFRAALDQSYDIETLANKPMATQGNGTAVSPLAKSDGDSLTRTQEKKRGNKGYKLFGIFKVGKTKRSISSDRNLDSNSPTASSPRLAENEAHKRYLEATRENDFKKHQEESERIQAKAREMREKQEQERRREEIARSRAIEDRVRAPSVPVTAMQRMSVDQKVMYAEASGRRSVDPITMRNSQTPTFDWHTSKRPTSPVNYHEPSRHRRHDKKSNAAKYKANPDYSSLPRKVNGQYVRSRGVINPYRKPGTQSSAGTVQNDSDGIVEDVESDQSDPKSWGTPSAYVQSAKPGLNGNDYNNYHFYNAQKPPSGRSGRDPRTGKQTFEYGAGNHTMQRKGRPGKHKAGRPPNHNDGVSAPAPAIRSKTPQPQSCHREDYAPMSRKSDRSTGATTDFATMNRTFQREQSPEPPPVVMRRQNRGNSTNPNSYRHSVHIDNPVSRAYYERSQSAREPGQRPSVITNYWKETRPQAPNHDHSDSDRTASPTFSTAEINRNAVKKILDRTGYVEKRTRENFVISQPYNL